MNSGIAGSASNLSLLIIHIRLRERLLDPTGWAKISSELSWIPTTGKRSIQNCFYNTIRSSNISCCNFLVGHLGVSEPVGLQLLAGGRTGLLWALRAFFGHFGPGWLCPDICLFSVLGSSCSSSLYLPSSTYLEGSNLKSLWIESLNLRLRICFFLSGRMKRGCWKKPLWHALLHPWHKKRHTFMYDVWYIYNIWYVIYNIKYIVYDI